jgi:hypothetical protein
VVEDLDNGLTTTTRTDGDGNFTVDDIIPGDDYTVTQTGGTPVTVTPHGDGDDMGIITVNDGVNFKVSITGGTALTYVSDAYTFVLSIQNTGDTDATATTYALSFDSGLQWSSGSYGILDTIDPGKSKKIEIKLSLAKMQKMPMSASRILCLRQSIPLRAS